MKKLSLSRLSLLFTLLLFSFPTEQITAQSVSDIMDQMLAKHSRALEGIETMRTITISEGFLQSEEPDTVYYKKVTLDDGTNILESVSMDAQAYTAYYGNFTTGYESMVENSRYEGIETVDGKRAHAIFIEDVTAIYNEMDAPAIPGDQSGEPQSGWFFIDANDLVPLRMTFDIQVEEEYSGTIEMNFRDYRSVSGVPMAFELEMVIDGISDSVSAEDMAEARKNIQELREQLDGASGMQKRIMETVVAPQLEKLEKILEDGSMNMKITILEAEANVAIPLQEAASN